MEPLGGALIISLGGATYGTPRAEVDLAEGRLVAIALGDDLERAPEPHLTASWHPEERALLAGFPPRRARTWVGGRIALKSALRGAPATSPIVADARGAPSLPNGLTGSIAHKDPVAVALAAGDASGRVGVDVELAEEPTTLRLAPKILRPDEADLLVGTDAERSRALLLAFSAKEAIYKAIDPFVRRYVGFHEVRLVGDPGRYRVEPALRTGERLAVEARAFVAGDVIIAVARATIR